MSSWCATCGEFMFSTTKHICPPVHEIFDEEWLGDEPREVYAIDHEEAARKYGEITDRESADYDIVSGNPHTVKVVRDGVVKWFKIEGESVPEYHAYEVPDPCHGKNETAVP